MPPGGSFDSRRLSANPARPGSAGGIRRGDSLVLCRSSSNSFGGLRGLSYGVLTEPGEAGVADDGQRPGPLVVGAAAERFRRNGTPASFRAALFGAGVERFFCSRSSSIMADLRGKCGSNGRAVEDSTGWVLRISRPDSSVVDDGVNGGQRAGIGILRQFLGDRIGNPQL